METHFWECEVVAGVFGVHTDNLDEIENDNPQLWWQYHFLCSYLRKAAGNAFEFLLKLNGSASYIIS